MTDGPVDTGLEERVDALEARVVALEAAVAAEQRAHAQALALLAAARRKADT